MEIDSASRIRRRRFYPPPIRLFLFFNSKCVKDQSFFLFLCPRYSRSYDVWFVFEFHSLISGFHGGTQRTLLWRATRTKRENSMLVKIMANWCENLSIRSPIYTYSLSDCVFVKGMSDILEKYWSLKAIKKMRLGNFPNRPFQAFRKTR